VPFPEELIYRLIKFYSYRGNVVLDPFGGTGTVAAVAARTARHFVHLDLSKKYCEIAAQRVAAEIQQMKLKSLAVPSPVRRRMRRKKSVL